MTTRKIYRSKDDRAILGICGGLGEYLEIDPIIIRLIVVILTLLGCSGLLFYIIAIFVIPEHPEYIAMKNGGYEYSYSTSNQRPSQSGEGTSHQENGTEAPTYDYEVGPEGEVWEAPELVKKPRRNGNGTLILGLVLIAAGLFIILRMFMPWIDMRLFVAFVLILIGILVIAKKK